MAKSYINEDLAAFVEQVRARMSENLDHASFPKPTQIDSNTSLARFIDHTQLKLDATREQISQLCREAVARGFATVCVRPNYVAQAVKEVANSGVGVACVVGFHEGTHPTDKKVHEAATAVRDGAQELDVVLNRELLQAGAYEQVYLELAHIREAAPPPVVLKLILETSQLSRDEVIAACVIAGYAQFDFVKTSTGFCGRGASVDDVQTMHRCAAVLHGTMGQKQMQVKASGGIRSHGDAIAMIKAGAARLGTSSGLGIVGDAKASSAGAADVSTGGAGPEY